MCKGLNKHGGRNTHFSLMDALPKESPGLRGVMEYSNGETVRSANRKTRHRSMERRRRKPNTLDIDYMVNDVVGTCGLWQWAVVILGSFAVPGTVIFPVFGNTEPLHRCKMTADVEKQLTSIASLTNFSSRDQFNIVAAAVGPWKTSGSSPTVNEGAVGCKTFMRNWDEFSMKSMPTPNSSVYPTEPCQNGYVYHFTDYQYPGGIVVEWDLVCEDAWKEPFSTSSYMVGMLIGFLTGGMAGDRFGRRPTALFACVLEGLSSIAVALAPNYWVYILSRGLLASATTIKIAVLLVLIMELTVASQRSLFNSFWSFVQGFILRALVSPLAFFLPNWRWLHAALTAPTILSFPCIWFFSRITKMAGVSKAAIRGPS
uniref:Solute carrier family 22 member 21 n=1 Tax=Schistocephalus solidus TaxID=70667 RepID=A0A0X3PF61_SCHSO